MSKYQRQRVCPTVRAMLLVIAALVKPEATADVDTPHRGEARVCVYRTNANLGALVPSMVEINRVELAKLRVGDYACAEIIPGNFNVSAILLQDFQYSESRRFEARSRAAEGATQYFKIVLLDRFKILEVPSDQALTEMASYRRVDAPRLIIAVLEVDGLDLEGANDWLKHYYRNSEPSRLPAFISVLASNGYLRRSNYHPLLVGFLSQLYKANEPLVPEWTKGLPALSPQDREVIYYALLMSDSPFGRDYVPRVAGSAIGDIERKVGTFRSLVGPDMLARPPESGEALDLLWGAFFSTGREDYLRQIASALSLNAAPTPAKRSTASAAAWSLTINAREDPKVMNVCESIAASNRADIALAMKDVVANAKKPKREPQSNSTVDPDARKSDARGSP